MKTHVNKIVCFYCLRECISKCAPRQSITIPYVLCLVSLQTPISFIRENLTLSRASEAEKGQPTNIQIPLCVLFSFQATRCHVLCARIEGQEKKWKTNYATTLRNPIRHWQNATFTIALQSKVFLKTNLLDIICCCLQCVFYIVTLCNN